MNVSFYKNTRATTGITVELDYILARIRTGEKGLKDNTLKARQLAATTRDAYRDFKATTLPAFTASGTFRDSERKVTGLHQHSGIVILDIDDLTDAAVATAIAKAKARETTRFAFISPSGKGIKIGVCVSPLPNAETHRYAWKTAADSYNDIGTADPSGKDVSRLCFLAHDENVIENQKAQPIEWSEPLLQPTHTGSPPTQKKRYTPEQAAHIIGYLDADMPYADWLNVGMGCHAEGLPVSVWETWSRSGSKYKPGECERKWNGFNANGDVSFGTVIAMAKASGWTPQHSRESHSYVSEPARPKLPADETPEGNDIPTFPEGVFLHAFTLLEKAYENTPFCKPFVFAMGLTAIGVCSGRTAAVSVSPNDISKDFPNAYSLIIGKTTIAAKSECREALHEMLWNIDDSFKPVNSISSREGLAVALRTDGDGEVPEWQEGNFTEGVRCLLSLDEAKQLFVASRRDATGNIPAELNDLWKCPRDASVRTRNNPIRVDYPVLNIFACSTEEWLTRSVIGDDIDGGFMNRFMPFLHERMPYIPDSTIDRDFYTPWLQFLRTLVGERQNPEKRYTFSEEARAAYHEWAEARYEAAYSDEETSVMTARAPAHARRIALALAIGGNRPGDDIISIDSFTAAKRVAEYLADAAVYLFRQVGRNAETILERKILGYLNTLGNEARASNLLSVFPSKTRPAARQFHQIIEGLIHSDILEVVQDRPKVIRRIG